MSIVSSLTFDNNHELQICIQEKDTGKNYRYKIGKITDGKTGGFFYSFIGIGKIVKLANKQFMLTDTEITTLKNNTISALPISDQSKEFIIQSFNQLFNKKEIDESEIVSVIDEGLKFDHFRDKVIKLFRSKSRLTSDELHMIFGANEENQKRLQNLNLSTVLKSQLLKNYENMIEPLVERAKREIKTHPKHFSVQAAAEKGRALQAGMKTIMAIENNELPIPETKISINPETESVFKRGEAESREEEHLIASLMNLSMEKGTVPIFSFSSLSSERFLSREAVSGPQLSGADVKPYVEGMLTFDDLLNDEILFQRVIERLDQDSEFMAVLTAEFQFLDLHKDGMGVVPLLDEKHEAFQKLNFAYGLLDSVSFHKLYKDFLSGNINEETKIYFSSSDNQMNSGDFHPLKEIPGLLDALNCPWKFVIFDMDRALAESNAVQTQTRNGVSETLIPFRSVLLGTSWKSQPLHQSTIDMLQSESRNKQIRHWVNRMDAPIRKWMKDPQKIDDMIKKEIEQDKYTLSYHRSKGLPTTVEDLRNAFCEDLCRVNLHRDLWMAIQQQLSTDPSKGFFKPYTVKKEDSLEEIARSHHLTFQELVKLNPNIETQFLEPGMKLQVKQDLLADSSSSLRLRKTIAGQLFPRLSWKQRDALFERQERRKEYLQNIQIYRNIAQHSPRAMGAALKKIIESPSTPITSNDRINFLEEIDEIVNRTGGHIDMQDFQDMLNVIKPAFTPTYFNLAKAMYPLLADTYELLLHQSRLNERTAGMNIGFYGMPFETLLSKARDAMGNPSPLAARLQTRLAEIDPTAFFGEWEDMFESDFP